MNIYEQQASNRRTTAAIMALFVAFFLALGLGFDYFYLNFSPSAKPQFKWNAFGICYTDCPDWRSPPESYKTMVSKACKIAGESGTMRITQLGNPYMLKESDPYKDILGGRLIEIGLIRGYDDFILYRYEPNQ